MVSFIYFCLLATKDFLIFIDNDGNSVSTMVNMICARHSLFGRKPKICAFHYSMLLWILSGIFLETVIDRDISMHFSINPRHFFPFEMSLIFMNFGKKYSNHGSPILKLSFCFTQIPSHRIQDT